MRALKDRIEKVSHSHKTVMQEIRVTKTIRHMENKQQNDRSPS